MTNTKARSQELHAAALRIVGEFGIARLDAMPNPLRKTQLTMLRKQLVLETNCTREAARQHIAKAARRLRSPDVPTEDAWGGARNGAGRRKR